VVSGLSGEFIQLKEHFASKVVCLTLKRFLHIEVNCQRALKPARVGGIKSSHFEGTEVRRTGSSTTWWLTECCYGESAQDGEDSLDSTVTFDALVRPADR
jgi:hypothetical protein